MSDDVKVKLITHPLTDIGKHLWDTAFRDWMITSTHEQGQARSNANAGFMPKTKRPRKVHFVWADTNGPKCQTHVFAKKLMTTWAPEVTCTICRDMMVNRGITGIR